jgi:hypothetical protein
MKTATELAAELVEGWRHDFNIRLTDAALGELTRRIAAALASAEREP